MRVRDERGVGGGLIGAVAVTYVLLLALRWIDLHFGLHIDPVAWLDTAIDASVRWIDSTIADLRSSP